eukprot:Phypoly_transcript_15037.p1 GENE.Phypoly_transcript_15037~~Phypoly_transcript_15037.p1  ORF type:complete len:259 (+),score=27.71 Phypoly_transcript_15037:86-862(+)
MGAVVAVLSAVTFFIDLLSNPPASPPAHLAFLDTPAAPYTSFDRIREARQNLGIDVVHHYNFAFVGASGSGKSSLVNALRQMNDSDPRAAAVGESETTQVATRYCHPSYAHIMLWDLPGAGTTMHPASTYFRDKALFAFDCLLIVTDDRFLQVDLDIAKEAVEWKVPVFFVRNKADAALQSKRRRCKDTDDIKFMLRTEVSKSILPQLERYGLHDRRIYIISSWAFIDSTIETMDEQTLLVDIINTAAKRAETSYDEL